MRHCLQARLRLLDGERRWRTFCAMNGLRYTQSGTSITWDPGPRAPLIARIARFNDLFGAGNVGAAWGTFTGPSHRTWPHTRTVLDWFLDYMKTQLEAELATPP